MTMKTVCLLGSTGSIGESTLDVLRHHAERFRLVGLAAGRNATRLAEQAREFAVEHVALAEESGLATLRERLGPGASPHTYGGAAGLVELVEACRADIVVGAITGAAGIPPNLRALQMGARLALANKESLVVAGELFTRTAREHGAEIVPIDSEHSALAQALAGGHPKEVRRLILTASGGPFRTREAASFASITVAEALAHPTWSMGRKITIDSATMMNKTLEVLEAHWLFEVARGRLEVVVHPQSLVHSMVEFVDGSIMAQMSVPDMRLPIQYALTYPQRLPGPMAPFRVEDFATLTFEPADTEKFPALQLGFEAAQRGGTMGAVLNGANEVAVERFLACEESRPEAIRFVDIATLVRDVMAAHEVVAQPTLEETLAADRWARERAAAWTPRAP